MGSWAGGNDSGGILCISIQGRITVFCIILEVVAQMISLHFIELEMIYFYVISKEFHAELTYDSVTQLSTFLRCSKPEPMVRSALKLDHFAVRYRAEGRQIEEIEKSTAWLLETRPSGQI